MNDLVVHNLNYDIPFDINPGGIVIIDYVNYMTTDSIHPNVISYNIMRNLLLEDDKKLMFVDVETYAE